ncbi:hypothetical protein LMG28614_04257 [Paraburkholderia ultramafica]|uniref:Uncharacterized protein n=1 Tax=Paraburkholderia ultramafica TaxID=1544867 RepID=A0A6S7BCS9_9BURK|nr:hypothetical protein LMG28614_04257 [Paraburkholderia ultramafica]
MHVETLNLARGQFAMTAIFHILWPILTISLSAFLLIVEMLWVRPGAIVWYQHARFAMLPVSAAGGIADAACSVRRSPYTTHGWRPTSRTIQPHSTAT